MDYQGLWDAVDAAAATPAYTGRHRRPTRRASALERYTVAALVTAAVLTSLALVLGAHR